MNERNRVEGEIFKILYPYAKPKPNDLVDAILNIKGLLIEADNQELPKNIYANERDWKVSHGTQQEMLRKNFKRVIKEE